MSRRTCNTKQEDTFKICHLSQKLHHQTHIKITHHRKPTDKEVMKEIQATGTTAKATNTQFRNRQNTTNSERKEKPHKDRNERSTSKQKEARKKMSTSTNTAIHQ